MSNFSPRRRRWKIILALSAALAALLTVPLLLPIRGIAYFNFTRSMPKGIYLVAHSPLSEARFVVIPTSKINSFGEKLPHYLLKQLLPYHGELVTINDSGLFLDGKLIAPRAVDFGISFSGKLQPGQAILLGQTERSFDSRYFGPVNIQDLTPVTPLLTW